MKRSIVLINTFLVITIVVLVVFNKYYPSSTVEVYLGDYYPPEKISEVLSEKYPCEYLNIYEILSTRGNVNVYLGNINIILRKYNINDYGINQEKDTLIVGDKYIANKYIYSEKNPQITTQFGEYNLRAVIDNNNNAYYRDTDILKNNQVRRQRLYLIMDDSENVKRHINFETVQRFIESEGIKISKSISYSDVSGLLKKLILLLCLMQVVLWFIYIQKNNISRIKVVKNKYIKLKYDMSLGDYLLDKQNLKSVLTVIGQVIMSFVLLIIFGILFVMIINIRLSFSLNPTSFTSIKDTIMLFANLLSYFIKYGFTDIAIAILGIFTTYLLAAIVACIVFFTKFNPNKNNKINLS